MQDKTEQTTSFAAEIAASPWIKGPLLGAATMFLVTPGLKWTNHVYNNEKMPWGNFYSGAGAYALSAIPGYAVAFAFKAFLSRKPEETSQMYELFSSSTAGAVSGFFCTPFEALAQNKQLTHSPSLLQTAKLMRQQHGYASFFQGGASVALREGTWAAVYMTVISMMSQSLQKQGFEEQYAMLAATLAAAGSYGLLSSPLGQLRYRKQKGLTEPGVRKSYLEHAKDIFYEDPKASNMARVASFFKAGFPRSVTTTVAAGLMVKGGEWYDQLVGSSKP